MIVTTPIFKGLKDANPHLRIGVLASQTNAEIIRHNPYVDKIHILPKHWWQLWWEIIKARKEQYDVVLNLVFNRTTSGGILSNLIAPKGIKVGQGDGKYRFYFNRLLKLSRITDHMVETLVMVIKDVFNVSLEQYPLKYEITVDELSKNSVKRYLVEHNLRSKYITDDKKYPYLVFNLSANDSVRRISAEQANAIGQYLGSITAFRTILLHAPNDLLMLSVVQQLASTARCLPFPEQGNSTLLEIAALIEGASVVITPDTSIIHFASAMKTPVLGFYTEQQGMYEWLPYQVHNSIVKAINNGPTSSIPVDSMIEEVKKFIIDMGLI
jgi:ADP-heptose:LPS heptosyltransferase